MAHYSKGHFILTSGKHSDTYFEKFNVLNQPKHVETLCRALAPKIAPYKPDIILGPTTLGVLLAYEVAKNLGLPAAYGEKGPENTRILRKPEHIPAGARVAIVDDVLNDGRLDPRMYRFNRRAKSGVVRGWRFGESVERNARFRRAAGGPFDD